jgi:hypothetical protein
MVTRDLDKATIHDIDTPVPVGLPTPPMWKLLVMPVRQMRMTKGGILLADETLDTQAWVHQLYKICAVGKHVYKGPAYAGYDISEDEIPKVGELWLIDPKQPRRFGFDGYTIIVINDDQLQCRASEDHVHKFKFAGFELA